MRGIQRMTNVRPLLATPLWILDQIHRHGTDQASIQQIKKIWDMVTEDFLSLDVLRTNQFTNPGMRSSLKLLFGVSRKMSLPTIAGMSRLLRNHVGEEHISIARFARQEANIRSGQADIAIYGHTHSHEVVPLEKRAQGRSESGQVYINTGAWATIFDYSQQHKTDQKTVPMNLLTCVALYREGERQGRRYETWWANFA
jgi:UDP-2,3-diacylglucosamine pyrophosphatase LpxH